VPAVYNGMATGADWMSAASFIGMAGTLYLTGYGGLAFIMGWTGGYCLVALFLAPYLRKFGQFTSPTSWARATKATCRASSASWIAILCSFTYVVAQIYGVGLITTRLSGLAFESASSSAWAASWCARSWAACVPSPGRRWRSTSS
jgi:cation/acetate symporter